MMDASSSESSGTFSSTDEDEQTSFLGGSVSSAMTEDERRIMNKINSRIDRYTHFVQVKDLRKPSLNELRALCDVYPSTVDACATICVIHTRAGFRIERFSEDAITGIDSLVDQLNQFASANPIISIANLLERCAEIVQQERLTQLMDTLGLEETEEVVSETQSISSAGTTAASPQSACSTTPSVEGQQD